MASIELLTPDEVAEILKVTSRTVRQMLEKGELPCIKLRPRIRRVRRDELDEFLKGKPQGSADPVPGPAALADYWNPPKRRKAKP